MVVLLKPVTKKQRNAFGAKATRATKRQAATPPTKKVFVAQAYDHSERLLSDFERYLVASENKSHPHEV